jgi:CheY-like chemotaxis protein
MNLRSNLTIRQRIAAGYYFIIIVATITSVASIITFENNKQKYNKISEVYLPSVSNLKELKTLLNDSKKQISDWIYQPNTEEKERLKALQDKDYPALKAKMRNVANLESINDAKTVNLLLNTFDTVITNQKAIMQTLASMESYSSDSTVDEALVILDRQVNPRIKDLNVVLDKILAEQNHLLKQDEQKLNTSYNYLTYVMVLLIVIVIGVGMVASRLARRTISKPIDEIKGQIAVLGRGEIPEIKITDRKDEIGEMTNALSAMTESIKIKTEFASETGKGNYEYKFDLLSDKDILGLALVEMKENLKKNFLEQKNRVWLNKGVTEVNDILRANQDKRDELYQTLISFVTRYLDGCTGALFLKREDKKETTFEFAAGFAFDKNIALKKSFAPGEGFIGQVAAEKKSIVLHNLPENYIRISSGYGDAPPRHLAVLPLVFENDAVGVLEIATLSDLTELHLEFLELTSKIIASALDLIARKEKTEKLLQESQELNIRMQAQEEELKVSNEELVEKTNLLQVSEEELKVQQEELIQTNTQLEEKAQLLAQQNEAIRVKNDELEVAREAIRIKAEELEMTSRYKSEFLANMSHELRTPLNSILILANLLSENKEKTLTDKQAEYARVINKSGSDLLSLINDILDLSKIESRKLELEVTRFEFQEVGYDIESLFRELAISKKINFSVNIGEGLPQYFVSDKTRLEQVIKNLLSNAFKFTPAEGSISLNIFKDPRKFEYRHEALINSDTNICFEVKDTGIGIPKDKQQLIFEAFQQADGSTNRKYGGTGLGLSISRELSNILGGEIHVESVPSKGSTFSLVLAHGFLKVTEDGEEAPTETVKRPQPEQRPVEKTSIQQPTANENHAPAESARKNKLILIIEDDMDFANILLDEATEKGFRGIIADQGDTGLKMAKKYNPDAIILDIGLPMMDGWEVLKKLKADDALKNIPVHIMTGSDNEKLGKELGAVAFLKKPVSNEQLSTVFVKIKNESRQPLKKILIVEDNAIQNNSVKMLLENNELSCVQALTGSDAIRHLGEEKFDLVVLDLSLPDISGFDLLKQIRSNPDWLNIPVIVYTGKELSPKENKILEEFSNAVVVKTTKSPDRLLDETTLFLKRLEKGTLNKIETTEPEVTLGDELLKGKKVLMVDDDMRNIFALSRFLEKYDFNIVVANDGMEALEKLKDNKDTDIVLMDIMMPEMDGYEATRKIREQKAFAKLPIIALTAKAMKGDREKCIEAGASDYATKPIDTNKLISLMRVWLSK